ncbi:MAG TPA: Tim44/TimA family putative adaptor protein [Alphaproteobacteria bacterium]|nr:Tim44/TimA family putative adaptor protein [Alphaproteobacteria bacterium]
MGESGSVFDILIFAVIAIVLLFRLRAVLGRRTGEEQERSNPFDRPTVVPFRAGVAGATSPGFAGGTVIEHDPNLPLSLDARVARVHAVDPTFDEKHFLNGAKSAFRMVVQAFAAGDLATLRSLLNSQLYGEFGRAISERREHGQLGSVEFEGPIEAEIVDARASAHEVQIQVRFGSRQLHDGETVAPEAETIDLWTFARDPSSRDPNWQLVETASH